MLDTTGYADVGEIVSGNTNITVLCSQYELIWSVMYIHNNYIVRIQNLLTMFCKAVRSTGNML